MFGKWVESCENFKKNQFLVVTKSAPNDTFKLPNSLKENSIARNSNSKFKFEFKISLNLFFKLRTELQNSSILLKGKNQNETVAN